MVGRGTDRDGTVYLHQLDDPRPFALLMTDAVVVDSDEFALAHLDDPRFDARRTIVLHQQPRGELSFSVTVGRADVISFAAEEIVIRIDSPENAILSLSLPHFPGWSALLDGEPAEIMRAYAGLSAVEIPAGQHTLSLAYAPLSYRIGSAISLITWLGLAVVALFALRRR